MNGIRVWRFRFPGQAAPPKTPPMPPPGDGTRCGPATMGELTAAQIEGLCEEFHDAYERAAVGAGWETQARSRKPWSDVPEANKATMRATITAVFASPAVERILAARAAQGSDLAAKVAGVRALLDDESRHLVRWIDGSHLVDVADLEALLADPADTGDGSGM